MIASWVSALLRHRTLGFVATALGIAVAVALLGAVGSFIAVAQTTMTDRAVSNVAVDWQVEVASGAELAATTKLVESAAGVRNVEPIGFATADSFSATTGVTPTTQTTGTGVVLGLSPGYQAAFPGQVRLLTGTADGAMVAQQTAANLHVVPGDHVTVTFAGQPVDVTISGVVELPQANSLFQVVGAPAASQPTAPPDNVILLPTAAFATATATLAQTRPDLLSTQLHVTTDRVLDPAPAAAYVQVTQAANNLEAQLAGAGRVGNNLAASLDAARSDAAYAQVLFLFLGLPGAVLAALLTIAVATSDAAGRRRDDALIRLRGGSMRSIASLAAGEAGSVAVLGGIAGIVAAWGVSAAVLGAEVVAATIGTAWPWFVAAFIAGIVIATLAVLLPALSAGRSVTISDARRQVASPDRAAPWWSRIGLDLILCVLGVVLVVVTTQTGYSLVLAPEGVATINVNYWAFLGPALLWVGGGLLGWRLLHWLLNRRQVVATAIRPLTGRLAGTGAAMFARRRGALTRSAVLLGLALAFATSTAVFNSTYEQQAEVDAQLTNGSDVRVTLPAAVADPAMQTALAGVAGVDHVEPVQHRYAYVGADLQDLYGVDPTTIGAATLLQDAYFQGGTAAQLLAKLAATPDGVLVSAETVTDYQLQLGDAITLRLVDSSHPAPTPVTFHYIGIALEFPTAPHDSFLVTNASYVASQTGDAAVDTYLIGTSGASPKVVAAAVQRVTGQDSTVTPIGTSRTSIGSSLTSVDLRGLTTIELGFAVVLAIAAAGLVLILGLRERRRTVAISSLMGASARQLRRLVFAEALVVLFGGVVIGALMGIALSNVLVAVLAGVFDPPPAALAVPWFYLSAVAVAVVAVTLLVSLGVARGSRRPPVELLRES